MKAQFVLAALLTAGSRTSLTVLAKANQRHPVSRIEVPQSVAEALDIDTTLIGRPVFNIVKEPNTSDNDAASPLMDDSHGHSHHEKRQNPMKFQLQSAEDVSMKPIRRGGKKGVFYRSDSRPPSEVFKKGFVPGGTNTNLVHHLTFQGPSGLVSLTRSLSVAAEISGFGRLADNETAYVYVVAYAGVPRGFWVPGIYPPEKNPSVAENVEFAVAGSVPGSSISHAYEVKLNKPLYASVKVKNEDYVLASAPGCFWTRKLKKRAAMCNPTALRPDQDIIEQFVVPVLGKAAVGKGRPANIPISENLFVTFIRESDLQFLEPIIRSIQSGEIDVGDYHLALKRAMSEVLDIRYTNFSGPSQIATTLAHIALDILSAARFAIPREYWEDVVERLPVVAKEISKAKTHKEKLKIANMNINAAVKAWESTPVGTVNELLMGNNPFERIDVSVQGIAQLWSYTPLGWVMSRFTPVGTLLSRMHVREDFLKFGLLE